MLVLRILDILILSTEKCFMNIKKEEKIPMINFLFILGSMFHLTDSTSILLQLKCRLQEFMSPDEVKKKSLGNNSMCLKVLAVICITSRKNKL